MTDLTPAMLDHLRQATALGLWHAGAVRVNVEEPFTLASGKKSPIYVNCRQVISSPAFLQLFTAYVRLRMDAGDLDFDATAGGETAGIPFAAYLARDLAKPMLYVRKKAKGYGIASKVEGTVQPGWKVLLVEDLITDGGSKIGFLDALRAAEAEVTDALVLFDRQQGGAELMAEHGVRLHAVSDRQAVLDVAERHGLLSVEERGVVEGYFADPEGWRS